jgi:hypothetical protein
VRAQYNQGFADLFLDDSSSYPYSLAGNNARGLQIVNTDTSNELTVTITFSDDTTLSIPVPASSAYNSFFESFKSITTSGSASTYKIGVVF